MRAPSCRLYLISPPVFALEMFAPQLEQALAGGEVAAFQLRLKDVTDAEVLRAAERLIGPVQAAGCAFLLNDRPDLAAACGADGVHVGQQDAPYAQARRVLGPERIVGVTCHDSRHLAMEAGEAGADYVAFGAFFPTTTKAAPTRADPALLAWWQETMEIPCVAIGGITLENAPIVIEAGADFLAVSSAVWSCPQGPGAAVRQFNALMA